MKKKLYIQPVVELTQSLYSSNILMASNTGLGIGGTPIGGGEGGD